MSLVIGISGFARTGKDLFCKMLLNELPGAKRFALADELKLDVRDFCIEKYGIDPVTCNGEDKTKIRDFLVFHGGFMRQKTQGRYWTSILEKQIKEVNAPISIVTDCRYAVYENDELHWIKRELCGVLVHLSLFRRVRDAMGETKCFLEAPNEHERKNDPILKENADYRIEWQKQEGTLDEIAVKLRPYALGFINWLKENNKL
jgi:hypothetical protein